MKAPRIAPIEPPYDPETARMLAKWMPPGADAPPLKLFRTLAVHEDLMSRMRPLGAGILGHGLVPARVRELMILRTCALNGAEYEWGVHVSAFAAAVGLGDAEVQATATGEAGAIDPGDAVVLRLADELHATSTVSDELWAELAERFQQAELIELLAIAGWYRLLSYVINAAGIELEPWAARFSASASSSQS
jgi:alkylhydroperoxidase family enzyme